MDLDVFGHGKNVSCDNISLNESNKVIFIYFDALQKGQTLLKLSVNVLIQVR